MRHLRCARVAREFGVDLSKVKGFRSEESCVLKEGRARLCEV